LLRADSSLHVSGIGEGDGAASPGLDACVCRPALISFIYRAMPRAYQPILASEQGM
jgi:hypothetical protein